MSTSFPDYYTPARIANTLHQELATLYRGKSVDRVLTEKYWREIEYWELEAYKAGGAG